MSDPFTIERFLPHVGDVFHVVVAEAQQTPILLSEITRLAADADARRRRQPFSLVLHAPAGTLLEQQVYRIEKPGMDPFDCFLVPIGPDQNGMRFEAVYA
jgi:hypothetical protein